MIIYAPNEWAFHVMYMFNVQKEGIVLIIQTPESGHTSHSTGVKWYNGLENTILHACMLVYAEC